MWKGSMILVAAAVMPLSCQDIGESKAMAAAPALPYVDQDACPFEGCAYREWTARKSVVVYDTWEERRDLAQQGLRSGDTVLVYTNLGEGLAKVWFKGRFYSEFDITFAAWPDRAACGGVKCIAAFTDVGKSAWWAQVKLKSGRIGWVEMDTAGFDGVDQLAGLPHLTAAGA